MKLDSRLNILKEAGSISNETFEQLNKVIDMFEKKCNIYLTEENGAMLITHLSIALERIKNEDTIEGIEPDIYRQIENNLHYEKCKQLLEHIEKYIGMEMPESEKTYIMMYLCTLFDKDE